MKRGEKMSIVECIAMIGMLGIIIISAVCVIAIKSKSKVEYSGDLYVFPDPEEGPSFFVMWNAEPDEFINKDSVTLKVVIK